MVIRWYFTHDSRTFGPVLPGEINALAGKGKLGANCRTWPEGISAVLPLSEFVTLFRAVKLNQWLQDRRAVQTTSIPGWLSDVLPAERPQPAAGVAVDWLDDVRQTEAYRPVAAPAARRPSIPVDWLQEWVDAEANKPLILSGDGGALRNDPQLAKVVEAYQGYGQVMLDKLWKHFDFLIENRKKFYVAFA